MGRHRPAKVAPIQPPAGVILPQGFKPPAHGTPPPGFSGGALRSAGAARPAQPSNDYPISSWRRRRFRTLPLAWRGSGSVTFGGSGAPVSGLTAEIDKQTKTIINQPLTYTQIDEIDGTLIDQRLHPRPSRCRGTAARRSGL